MIILDHYDVKIKCIIVLDFMQISYVQSNVWTVVYTWENLS